MPVDVTTEIEIDRPLEQVASFTSDPGNAVARYRNIGAVECMSPRPVAVGSRIAFVAPFLGPPPSPAPRSGSSSPRS